MTAESYPAVAGRVLDALLAASPAEATELGDHRFDDRLADLSSAGVVERTAMLVDALSALDSVDDTVLEPEEQVDLEMLRTEVTRQMWTWSEWRPHERDPLEHLPGDAIYALLAREPAEPVETAKNLAARLRAVPEALAVARETLHSMPRVAVETAIGRTRGIAGMLGADVDALLALAPSCTTQVDDARTAAAEALEGYARWLEDELPVADGDPRLGPTRFAARLWYTLDTETGPEALLLRAESDLLAVEEEIAEVAARIAGTAPRPGLVREVLDQLAAEDPITDATILPRAEEAVRLLEARVRELDLVTVPPDPTQLIVMPESRRGVAVAYCDPPGALEPPAADGSRAATFFAVSPTPSDWSPERVASFYREYNGHMVRNLSVHEAMPGHVLQLAHAAQYRGSTHIRAALRSGPFVEGWAVYAEALVARHGLGQGQRVDDGLKMHQLKMQLRSTINAILDIRVHAHGMTEAEATSLMIDRGHQEEGEAAGKWRRALLTSAQLSTYYVGYHEVLGLARDLHEAQPDLTRRQLHDELLAHGSPPPRHLRALLQLG